MRALYRARACCRVLLRQTVKISFSIFFAESRERKSCPAIATTAGRLNVDKKEPGRTKGLACDLKPRCVKADTIEKLTVYCLRQHHFSKSAGLSGQRAFQMSRFTQLRNGKIIWSSTIREWLREHEKPDECIYCGVQGPLTTDHILPRSCGGPDIPDNAIRVYQSCNSGRGGRRLFTSPALRERASPVRRPTRDGPGSVFP